jgi:hypothetical protein
MTVHKLTLQEFREDFGSDVFGDVNLAQDIIRYLDEVEGAILVRTARSLLEASQEFDRALVDACLRRD